MRSVLATATALFAGGGLALSGPSAGDAEAPCSPTASSRGLPCGLP